MFFKLCQRGALTIRGRHVEKSCRSRHFCCSGVTAAKKNRRQRDETVCFFEKAAAIDSSCPPLPQPKPVCIKQGRLWLQPRSVLERAACQTGRLREIPSGSIYRIRLKIEQNCRLFLDIFSSVIINDLTMTFTSRLEIDAKCVYQ